jgi:hypothetical protein
MEWRKASGKLVYEADRQAMVAAIKKPTIMCMHGLNGAASATVRRLLVQPGDEVTPETSVIQLEASLKLPAKPLQELITSQLVVNGPSQVAKGSKIAGESLRFTRSVPVSFDMTPLRSGVVKELLVKEGDVVAAGAPLMSIVDKFKKTFKTQTLNVDVFDGAQIAYEGRQRTRQLHRVGLQPPMFAVHVTVVRGQERVPEDKQHLWKAHEGEVIEFEYCLTPEVKYGFWHLNVRSPRMMQLREELGLTAEHNLHLTIGRTGQ